MIRVDTQHQSEVGQQHKSSNSPPLDQVHSMNSFPVMIAGESQSCGWQFSSRDLSKVVESGWGMILTHSYQWEDSKKIFFHKVTQYCHLVCFGEDQRYQQEVLAQKRCTHLHPEEVKNNESCTLRLKHQLMLHTKTNPIKAHPKDRSLIVLKMRKRKIGAQ